MTKREFIAEQLPELDQRELLLEVFVIGKTYSQGDYGYFTTVKFLPIVGSYLELRIPNEWGQRRFKVAKIESTEENIYKIIVE